MELQTQQGPINTNIGAGNLDRQVLIEPAPKQPRKLPKLPGLFTEGASAMEMSTALEARKFLLVVAETPSNHMNMPMGMWIAANVLPFIDDLPDNPLGGLNLDELPDDAWVALDYTEGYPVIAFTGMPIWDRLPGESVNFHRYFQTYLDSTERNTATTASSLQASDPSVTPLLLKSLSILFHWELRAQGFDKYNDITEMRKRRKLTREMNEHHYTKGKILVDKAISALEDEERFNELDGGDLITLLKTASSLQRVALGADATSKGRGDVNIINTINAGESSSSNPSRGVDGSAALLARALRDPSIAAVAQELVLKLQAKQQADAGALDPRRGRVINMPGAGTEPTSTPPTATATATAQTDVAESDELKGVDLTTPGLETLSNKEFVNV